MQFLSGSNLHSSASALHQHLLAPMGERLTPQQSKIAIIASAVFSLLAAAFLYFVYCFKRDASTNTDSAQASTATARVVQAVVKTPLQPIQSDKMPFEAKDQDKENISDASKEEKQEAAAVISTKLENQKSPESEEPKAVQVMLQGDQKKAIPVESRDSREADEMDYDFETDEDAMSLDDPEDYSWMDEDSFDDDAEPKKALPPAAMKKYFIDGKECSFRTVKLQEKLEADLKKLGRRLGKAIDNGDCFWDSFAQGLSRLLKRHVTPKELREIVSAEVHRLDKLPDAENWVKRMIQKEYAAADTYEDYRDRVALDCGEILAKKLPAPVWGQEMRDGVILCRIFKVNLMVYTAGCIDDDLSKMEDPENFFSGEQEYPSGEKYPHTIEMALRPGHFMPVCEIESERAN